MMLRRIAFALAFALGCTLHAKPLREPTAGGAGAKSDIPPGCRNLFLKAKASADKTWGKQKPALAVNGNAAAGDHWAGPPIPATHTIDLGKPVTVNTIRMVTYYNGKRYYQYHIECSKDGKAWQRIVDQSKNTRAATAKGQIFKFEPVTARYFRTTFTKNSQGDKSGGHIAEIEGYNITDKPTATVAATGTAIGGSVGSVDKRYPRDSVTKLDGSRDWSAVAWRGERVHGQFVVWTETGLKDLTISATALKGTAGTIPADCVIPRYVRYTMGAGQLIGDILEPAKPIDIAPRSTRPVWLSVNVPADAAPGVYLGKLNVAAGASTVTFNIKVEVLAQTLPPPKQWSFHLDLWQHPWAVARVHKLEPWSEAHWAKLKEVLTMAANAGQKCLTATIVDRPWGGQTHDPFGAMVKPTKKKDGSWTYDYTLFDKWVAFGIKCGIDKQINCYSMVPWGNNLYYTDEASGKYIKISAKPGSKEYNDYWRPLLQSFTKHLKEKGWFEITTIAMDERHLEDMKNMIALVDSVEPNFKLTLAANRSLESIIDRIYDYCFAIKFKPNRQLNLRRAAQGKHTTYYVCCGPRKPNTFPFSPPAESTWLGWRAAAERYTGFLRWALCSYTIDPFMTTDYPRRRWPTGDCYLIYPGPRSSIRFERLREGIQDYEKIRVLREKLEKQGVAGKANLKILDDMLGRIVNANHTAVVNTAKARLLELSRKVK